MSENKIVIPAQARERLLDMRGTGNKRRLWSSDLSADELLVLLSLGFKPAGMVMGSSVYHVGYQMGSFNKNQELPVLTSALYNAREFAMERMRQEAEALGAAGIVGVRLELKNWNFIEDSIEYNAIGTAIYHPTRQAEFLAPDKRPFTSTLSGQDFFKVLKAGHRPTGLVLGNCVYHVAHRSVWKAFTQSMRNCELETFTTALYEARELAQERMDKEAEKFGADGIVDLKIEHGNFWSESHVIEFMAIGTAVKDMEGDYKVPEPALVLHVNG